MKLIPSRKWSLVALGLAILAVVTALVVSPTFAAQRAPVPVAHHNKQAAVFFPNIPTAAQLKKTHKSSGIFPATVQGSGNLLYSGGPVQHNPVSYLIFWGPTWTTTDSSTATIIESWFKDYAGSSIGNVLTQYSDTTGHINNDQKLAGVYFDSSLPPTDSSCTPLTTVEDSSVQTEAQHAITVNHWPSDGTNATYFVYLPSVDLTENSTSIGGSCSINPLTLGGYCAYHNWSSSSGVEYAMMLYPGALCLIATTGNTTSPNNNEIADSEVNITSHEQAESITDPYPPGNGWVDSVGYEIGDKCAWDFSAGTTHTSNGGAFEVQTEYSNATSSCVASL